MYNTIIKLCDILSKTKHPEDRRFIRGVITWVKDKEFDPQLLKRIKAVENVVRDLSNKVTYAS